MDDGAWMPNFITEAVMLVLVRKVDEAIVINGNIVVTLVRINGDKCTLGIEAPSDVPVHRREVHEAIQREKQGEKGAA